MATWRTVLIGTAKPMPTLPPPSGDSIWELIPITRPSPSSSGPPELPGLIAASVWITLLIVNPFGDLIWRWSAETIPAVDRAVEPERVADRDHGVADAERRGVAELERMQLVGRGVHLEQRDVGRRILADHLSADRLRGIGVAERDLDLLCPVDDVRVREYVALVVDHEARARRGPAAAAPERVERRRLGAVCAWMKATPGESV